MTPQNAAFLPMMAKDFSEVLIEWANRQPSVEGIVLIGSRQRPVDAGLEVADAQSDWDFHVITRDLGPFLQSDWAKTLPGYRLRAYAVRAAAIGATPKVAAIFDGADVDLVLIPVAILKKVRWRARWGAHRKPGWTQRRMQDVAEVIRPGWRFLKDSGGWGPFYQKAVDEVSDPWLDDRQVIALAEGVVCDCVWVRRKIARGELRTAQRTIYRELYEANLQLLHELRHRRGQKTFTKARRLERVASPAELAALTVTALPEPASLESAVAQAADTCRQLMAELVGDRWRWPELV
jgi:hypothetical protein